LCRHVDQCREFQFASESIAQIVEKTAVAHQFRDNVDRLILRFGANGIELNEFVVTQLLHDVRFVDERLRRHCSCFHRLDGHVDLVVPLAGPDFACPMNTPVDRTRSDDTTYRTFLGPVFSLIAANFSALPKRLSIWSMSSVSDVDRRQSTDSRARPRSLQIEQRTGSMLGDVLTTTNSLE
jgi:hypothetical protein